VPLVFPAQGEVPDGCQLVKHPQGKQRGEDGLKMDCRSRYPQKRLQGDPLGRSIPVARHICYPSQLLISIRTRWMPNEVVLASMPREKRSAKSLMGSRIPPSSITLYRG